MTKIINMPHTDSSAIPKTAIFLPCVISGPRLKHTNEIVKLTKATLKDK